MLKKIGKVLGKMLAEDLKHEGLAAAILNLIAALIMLYVKLS